jgi:hypothetical protein
MTEQEIEELAAEYKKFQTFLKVDRDLQKQGVWGFIASDQLGDVLKFVKLFDQKVLGVNND